ncbi:MAG: PEP-CTERM sorting domain-containing protein [Acidobacteria bacterium]|nr:PEP-CTERM sorting domain-containing protein [Acidobacteriota bacterium]MBS1864358.1 PEP-CTERM sorting domain-containing protein [Acidobacteriota bacterium]
MKFSKLFVLLLLVGLTASAAMADTIDPTVVIRQVDPPPVAITNPFGTIPVFATANQNVFAFQNDTGLTLVSLSVTLFGLNMPLDFSFGENPGDGIFANTQLHQNDNGSFTLIFSGVDANHTGLLPAICNTENSNEDEDGNWDGNWDEDGSCPQCVGGIYSLEIDGIPSGAIVGGSATVSAPEPATLLLLSAGLVGLAGLRKRRAAVQN